LPYFPKLAGIDAAYAEKTLAEFRGVSPPPNELFFEILKFARLPLPVCWKSAI
jgi:hypothetical protein